MNRKDFLKLKANLLCYGVALTERARAYLGTEHPEFFEKGFIDAVNMELYGYNICVSIAEAFAEKSGFVMDRDASGYFISGQSERVCVNFFPKLPQTGTVVDDLARLHARDCINIWPSTNCCYDKPELKCRFCSLQAERETPYSPEELSAGLRILSEKCPGAAFNFSGGTYKNPDYMLKYWISLVKTIRAFSDNPIAVEFAPPSELSLLDGLCAAGANAVIMNIEVANEDLRREICPGKSRIPVAHYHEAMKRAVQLFGFGQVSSVLIGGIQPAEDILREGEYLASIGVFPTVMPIRPLDNCGLSSADFCDPEELIYMGERFGAYMKKYGISPEKQPGCTKCGGCSLENECFSCPDIL